MTMKIVCFSLMCLLNLSVYAFAQEAQSQNMPQSTQEDYLPEEPEAPVEQAATQEETYLPFVSNIVVEGNRIISENTIINKLKTQQGVELSREVVNEDIKRLYATGYFQDVRFDLVPDGKNFKVIVVVDEKPVVNDIVIDGNISFKNEELLKQISIQPGQVLDHHLLKEGVAKIREKYQNKGFKFATIESQVDVNDASKEATIYVGINEGGKFKIEDIEFEGVSAFKTRYLKSKLKTKETAWWLFRSGVFKEDAFQIDMERIEYLYHRKGYLDVKVTPHFEYNEETNHMMVVIIIDEGQQYITGDVQIKGNRLFPESEVWGRLEMLPGEVYSQVHLQDDLDAVRRFYFERGYINARILPETNLNKSTGRVDITYQITEGDLYYVDKVKIRGNTKTKDKVIRRELRIRPGERFDGEELEYSKQRLNNLGYFEEVSYETEPGSAANKRDVAFKVKEKQTGELSFGAGISSIDQFIGFAEIAQRNFDLMKWPTFTGGGQSLSLRGRWGSVTRDIDFSFVEPYLLDKPISLGINAYNWERDSNNLDFDTRRRGAGVTLGKRFTDRIRGHVGYTLENVKIQDIEADAHPDVTASGEENTLSRFKVGVGYDSRDNVFTPTKGWYLSSSAEVVGGFIAGDQDYYNLQSSATKYVSIKQDHVIELKVRGGLTDGFGDSDQVPVFDRFFAGGLGTVRGYNYRRVGPKGNGNPIGGETLALASAEYVFPIIDNFKGAFFVDAGHVNSDVFDVEFGDFAVSVGPGIKINTPLGPITLYYGFPIVNRDDEDEHGRLEFNLSRGF